MMVQENCGDGFGYIGCMGRIEMFNSNKIMDHIMFLSRILLKSILAACIYPRQVQDSYCCLHDSDSGSTTWGDRCRNIKALRQAEHEFRLRYLVSCRVILGEDPERALVGLTLAQSNYRPSQDGQPLGLRSSPTNRSSGTILDHAIGRCDSNMASRD